MERPFRYFKLLCLVLCWLQTTIASEGLPKLFCPSLTHDFDGVYESESLEHTFIFKNTGAADLNILHVAPS